MYPQNQLAGVLPPQRFLNYSSNLTSTTKSGGTLTLTNASDQQQRLSGTGSHTVVLPAVTSLVIGTQYDIENDGATGTVTVRSSGLADIVVLQPGISAIFTSVASTGTGSDVWAFRQKTVPIFNVGTYYANAAQTLNLAPNANYQWSNYSTSTPFYEFNGLYYTCLREGWYAISLNSYSSFQPVVIEWLFSKPTSGTVTAVSVGPTFATFTCNNGFTAGNMTKVSGSLIDAYNFTGMVIYNITATTFDIFVNPTTGVGGGSNGLDVANITELWVNGTNISPQYYPYVKGQLSVATGSGPQIVNYENIESYYTTIASSSNGVDLSMTSVIYVNSNSNWPSTGQFQITTSTGIHVVTYTGKAGTTSADFRFTGCSGGTGIMSTGGAVARTRFLNCSSPGSGILSTGGSINLSLKTAAAYTSGGTASSVSSDFTAQYFFTGFVDGLLSNTLYRNTVQYLEFGDRFYFRNPGIWTIAGGGQTLLVQSLF